MTWASGILCAFDTETTGIDPQEARIVSAAIVLEDPATGKRWERSWLADPGIEIPLEATAVHGISTEQAQGQGESPFKVLAEVLTAFDLIREEYGSVPLVIYNASYDLTILAREQLRYDVPGTFPPELPVVDPLVCDRKLDPYRRGRRTLTAVAAAYGVTMSGAHTAEGDTLVSLKLARAMARKHPAFGQADLNRLQDIQRAASREWAAHFQEYRRKSDPSFVCDGSWPYRPAETVTVLWPVSVVLLRSGRLPGQRNRASNGKICPGQHVTGMHGNWKKSLG